MFYCDLLTGQFPNFTKSFNINHKSIITIIALKKETPLHCPRSVPEHLFLCLHVFVFTHLFYFNVPFNHIKLPTVQGKWVSELANTVPGMCLIKVLLSTSTSLEPRLEFLLCRFVFEVVVRCISEQVVVQFTPLILDKMKISDEICSKASSGLPSFPKI